MSSTQQTGETLIKSYRYLRLSMVMLVACLAVAVIDLSLKQNTILSSISAYYFTSARAIFVGALIAIGVCMIALKGTTDADDILLNIGGMLAPVVAVVPTARIKDHRKILDACEKSDGATIVDPLIKNVDCPTEQALQAVTEAYVENNMLALLVVAYVGLALTWLFIRRDGLEGSRWIVGFGIAAVVVAVTSYVFFRYPEFFVHVAHYAAAIPMFTCIVLVVIVNAVRRRAEREKRVQAPGLGPWMKEAVKALTRPRSGYAFIALAMVITAIVGGVLAWREVYEDTIFYLEAGLIILFGVFWVAQTIELLNVNPCPPTAGTGSDGRTEIPADDESARHPA
jgi:hypothetical protein